MSVQTCVKRASVIGYQVTMHLNNPFPKYSIWSGSFWSDLVHHELNRDMAANILYIDCTVVSYMYNVVLQCFFFAAMLPYHWVQ